MENHSGILPIITQAVILFPKLDESLSKSMPMDSQNKLASPLIWDLFCALSLVGIWPRFVEPRLVFTTRSLLPIRNLPRDLNGFHIVQISDLHFHHHTSASFLDKIVRKCERLRPDLIAFTGDFLCFSQLNEPERLRAFLQRFSAPYGCYAAFGNHDYASFISINCQGDYDVIEPPTTSSLSRAFSRLKSTITLTKKTTDQAKKTPLHVDLLSLLKETPFQVLHNTSTLLSIKGTKLNVCGLGEYSMGKLDAKEAFLNYNDNFPGVILLHNPDGVPALKSHPGDIILSGHTHGGQVNLPWMWKKFTTLENMHFKRGLIKCDDKWLYVNRGLHSVLPFRWFAPPEILSLTLVPA